MPRIQAGTSGDQLVIKESAKEFDETRTALREGIESRGLAELAVIDHAAGARAVGLDLREETVIAFGNPKAITILMQADHAQASTCRSESFSETPAKAPRWSTATPRRSAMRSRSPRRLKPSTSSPAFSTPSRTRPSTSRRRRATTSGLHA